MAVRAAHLVDHVLPDVPIRQWVLTLPHRLRDVLPWRHDLCQRVARILHGAVERHLRAWGQAHGIDGARGGGVDLTVHVHVLVLDGLWAPTLAAALRLHAAPPPSPIDVPHALAAIVPRVRALICQAGQWPVGNVRDHV